MSQAFSRSYLLAQVWRVGIMGYNARRENVELVLTAFRDGLKKQGWKQA